MISAQSFLLFLDFSAILAPAELGRRFAVSVVAIVFEVFAIECELDVGFSYCEDIGVWTCALGVVFVETDSLSSSWKKAEDGETIELLVDWIIP